jgi:hypothetical protein
MSRLLNSSTTKSFRDRFIKLPPDIRRLARKNFKLWLINPAHPSLHFKKTGDFWSARVGANHRALAVWNGDKIEWFWIGAHDEYEGLLR